ncbi:hypothetical protein N0V94_001202 [Neodidymelliopsis sp. IMI 364377]|nr:hypothetical protein N0V94_001202 [Neodidymelliopsis sp. IMI 364377]
MDIFEPIFQALAVMNPCIRFNDVDVVVNRNTLMKLFDFASSKRGKAQFHVDLNMVENTLFIGRKEKIPKRSAGNGYGRNFETEFTTEDSRLPGAEGHHRVIRYKLGGLNLVVRIETDAYYTECDENDESLNESFCRTFESTTRTTIPHDSPRPTQVLTQGTRIPHNITLELKSNSSKSQSMVQLWFGRTPYLCCAKQTQGLVQAANVIRLKQHDFEDWETKNQKHLLRLSWLLNELRRITVEKTSRGAAVLVMIERGAPLQIYAAKETYGALPKEVIERFWD